MMSLFVSESYFAAETAFLPHDAVHSADYAVARCLCCPSVRLFVCLSHGGILSKRLHIILKLFSPSGNHSILGFAHQTVWQYSDGDTPLTGRRKQGGMETLRF